MKANFMWPAMWPSYPPPGNSFFVDDPENQATADAYGVVVSTSHQEPMMRSTPIEWNLFGNGGAWDYGVNAQAIYNYWVNGTERAKPFESLYTMGMRGTNAPFRLHQLSTDMFYRSG